MQQRVSNDSTKNDAENFVCLNCGAWSSGSFCSSCGQKKFLRQQFHIRQALRDVFSEFSDLESSLGKTLKTLILRPGQLTRDYLNGKQKSYVTPVKLYLIVITLNFLVYAILENYSLVNIGLLKSLAGEVTWFQQILAGTQHESGLSDEAFSHEINSGVNDTLPVLLYFLIFAQALVLKIQFRAHHRYYIEHLIFALHFMSFGFLRDVVLLPFQFLDRQVAFVVSIVTTVGYLFFSLREAYLLTGEKLIIHTLLHYTIFFLLFALTIFMAVFISLRSLVAV